MSTKRTLNLPSPRLNQIAQLAEELGLTYSATIGRAMAALREQYALEHVLPGVEIKRLSASDGEALAVKLGDGEITSLSLEGAKELATAIRSYLGDERPRKGRRISVDHGFQVRGVKRAVGVCLPADAAPWQATPDVAEELADLLEASARV